MCPVYSPRGKNLLLADGACWALCKKKNETRDLALGTSTNNAVPIVNECSISTAVFGSMSRLAWAISNYPRGVTDE